MNRVPSFSEIVARLLDRRAERLRLGRAQVGDLPFTLVGTPAFSAPPRHCARRGGSAVNAIAHGLDHIAFALGGLCIIGGAHCVLFSLYLRARLRGDF